ncbi:hypothetical protein GPJ56_005673 [Histomonas meleagridis]|uniref:uncharacterized protein n=1 Tax=Histomonas meleagridis TaxID=135588 RepID=UPI003559BDCF|nr:hypothetical protein GPJ56_005673 [Histomonas meleagridis]KAH0803392.1 hypothetical protein GO595_003736 [Histomonas meleagridis]
MDLKQSNVVSFFFGAGILGVIIGGLSTLVYHALFYEDQTYSLMRFGVHTNVSAVILSCIVLTAAVVVIGIVTIVLLHCAQSSIIHFVFFLITLLVTIGVIIAQGIGINYTKYGDYPVPQSYSYYTDSDEFRNYADNYDETGLIALAQSLNLSIYEFYGYSDFFVYYFEYNMTPVVGSCVIDESNSDFTSGDPCSYTISTVSCIGKWSGDALRDYICKVETDSHETDGMTTIDAQKHNGRISRDKIATFSFSGFYYINIILIIVIAPATIVVLIMFIIIATTLCNKEESESSNHSNQFSDDGIFNISDHNEKEDKKAAAKRKKEEKERAKREEAERKKEAAARKKEEEAERKREAAEKKREAAEKKKEEEKAAKQKAKEEKKNKKKEESSSSSSSSDDDKGAAPPPPPPPPPPPAMPKYREEPKKSESTESEGDDGDEDDEGFEEEGDGGEELETSSSSSSSSSSSD